jgi:hypothetical protein
MLVLSRTTDPGKDTIRYRVPPSTEETFIDVVVTYVGGAKVKLGSVAPRDVVIERLEICEPRRVVA